MHAVYGCGHDHDGRIMSLPSWSRKWQWYITFPVCLASLPATVTSVFARTVMVSFQPGLLRKDR